MGISKALRMSLMAADVIQRSLAGDKTAIVGYRTAVSREFGQYLVTLNYYYSQEQRWPGQPFWQSRHVQVVPEGVIVL